MDKNAKLVAVLTLLIILALFAFRKGNVTNVFNRDDLKVDLPGIVVPGLNVPKIPDFNFSPCASKSAFDWLQTTGIACGCDGFETFNPADYSRVKYTYSTSVTLPRAFEPVVLAPYRAPVYSLYPIPVIPIAKPVADTRPFYLTQVNNGLGWLPQGSPFRANSDELAQAKRTIDNLNRSAPGRVSMRIIPFNG